MKKFILLISLLSATSSFANEACKEKLENLALAAFDATEFRVPEMDVSAEADMTYIFKEVTVYQYKASYSVSFQLNNGDEEECEVIGISDFVENL